MSDLIFEFFRIFPLIPVKPTKKLRGARNTNLAQPESTCASVWHYDIITVIKTWIHSADLPTEGRTTEEDRLLTFLEMYLEWCWLSQSGRKSVQSCCLTVQSADTVPVWSSVGASVVDLYTLNHLRCVNHLRGWCEGGSEEKEVFCVWIHTLAVAGRRAGIEAHSWSGEVSIYSSEVGSHL